MENIKLRSHFHAWWNAQLSIQMRTSTLVMLMAFAGIIVSLFVRSRVTTRYSRLSKELDSDGEEEDAMLTEMWNEPSDEDSDSSDPEKLTPSSHFDEFLKAIKVFGYLEHEVFNELTKSTRTLRVAKGERVHLKELDGFTVVISGTMKVYCLNAQSPTGYDFLNEIRRPAPISSLSSILSLFSESVEPESHSNIFEEVNATISAVAEDAATIVVIPSSAFRQLTIDFPVAAANIVQIILFRWSQITFRTCQRYLNLTQQFYSTEKYLNTSQPQIVKDVPTQVAVKKLVQRLKSQAEGADTTKVELGVVPPVKAPTQRHKSADESVFQTRPLLVRKTSSNTLSSFMRSRGEASSPVSPKSTPSAVSLPALPDEASTASSAGSNSDADAAHDSAEKVGHMHTGVPTFEDLRDLHASSIVEIAKMMDIPPTPIAYDFDRTINGARVNRIEDFSARTALVRAMLATIRLDLTRSEQANSTKSSNNQSSYSSNGKQRSRRPRSNTSPNRNPPTVASLEESSECDGARPQLLDTLASRLEIAWFRRGEYISKYGERSTGLVFVLDGHLEVRNHPVFSGGASEGQHLNDIKRGHITGFLETISSNTTLVDVVAVEDTCVAIILKQVFEHLVEVDPLLYISAAKTLTDSLTRPMVLLDFALEWISLKSGDRLLKQGAVADSIYFVLNGRIRTYQNKRVTGEFGHGSSLGELETMSGERYAANAVAVRDSELSRFPRSLIELLARQHPRLTFEMSRMVVQAMKARDSRSLRQEQFSNIKTLAVLATEPGLPVAEFAEKLSAAFTVIGKSVKVVTNAVILLYLGKYAFHRMGALKLKAYLGDLEDQYDVVLYVAEGNANSHWTRTCISEAHCLLLLADGSAPTTFSDVERLVVKSPNRSQAHLVLLHKEKQVKHGSTAKWLKRRPWITGHHHILMPFDTEDLHRPRDMTSLVEHTPNRVAQKINQIKNLVQDEIKLLNQHRMLRKPEPGVGTADLRYKNDFARLARILSGEAVGLVLGGGGARGLSHAGVLQALEEAGLPIDMIGGTSIGSLVGGLYAKDYDIVPLLRKLKQFSARVSSKWRIFLDLTYPMTAWTTGHAFNRAVWKALGDSRIEDFWIRYFTNSTNLSLSQMEVHQRGYAWRYVRASMSLAGIVPPLEEKGHMLLDGGYMDNLPVSEMKKMGARYIIAVDVGAVDDTTLQTYGDKLSGFWALVNKYNPLSSQPNVPDIAEIQQRLTYVSSVKALEEAKVAEDVIYLRPPIDNYATLDFNKFDEIRDVGFAYGQGELNRTVLEKKLPQVSVIDSGRKVRHRRYSF